MGLNLANQIERALLQLVLEKNDPLSKYRQFIESVPKSYGLPFLFDDLLVSTQVTQLRTRIQKEQSALTKIYLKIRSAVENYGSHYSRSDFDWAYSLCKTRMVDVSGVEYPEYCYDLDWLELLTCHDGSILAPFFDMINHSNQANCDYWYDTRNEVLKIGLLSDVAPGKQLLIDYGPRPDDYLFQCYGFCLKPGDNEMNRIDLQMDEICISCDAAGLKNFWSSVESLEKFISLDAQVDLSIDYDRLWLNKTEVDSGLWTLLVWLVGGDLLTMTGFKHSGVSRMSSEEIETRVKCIELLLSLLKMRLDNMKKNEQILQSKQIQIDSFTLKCMRSIRLSHSGIIFAW